jgi:hypothetical protein
MGKLLFGVSQQICTENLPKDKAVEALVFSRALRRNNKDGPVLD